MTCWCGSTDVSVCWRTPRFGLVECRACGCRRIDPPPLTEGSSCTTFYNRYYRADRTTHGSGSRSHRSSRFWEVAAREPSLGHPRETVIDIGCGEGQLCAELFNAGWKTIIGFDVATPRIERARIRHPHLQFFDRSIDESSVARGTVDLAVMDNVIEHVPEPLVTVRDYGSYLRPDGRFVVITPNMESGHYRLLGRRWSPELAPHAHIFLFTPAALRRLLETAGLEVEAIGSFHQPGASVRELLTRLGRGDIRGAIWRAGQDLGGVYGRLIGAGPMLYAIARRRAAAVRVAERRVAVNASALPAASGDSRPAACPQVQGVSVVVCTYRRPASVSVLLDSLEAQDTPLHELLVIDASPDEEAEPTRLRLHERSALARRVRYWQVDGPARGLTRQRNFALQHVTGDLVLFLDDDVILYPDCIRKMEAVHRNGGDDIAGVGCYSDNQFGPPPPIWRIRRALGLVPTLQPGRYCRSGMSIPWGFECPARPIVEGDWLPGSAMMWKTDVVLATRFDETFGGYAQGEDLDFSLRARTRGRLVMLGTPRLRHVHETRGRPDLFRLGYMELRNRYEIHRRAIPGRTWRDVAWFAYAWTIDTLLLARHLAVPGRCAGTLRQIAGRIAAAAALCVDGRPFTRMGAHVR